MAAVPPQELVGAVIDAIRESGGQSEITSALRTHPRTFRVVTATTAFDLWVYLWTITHGGATRSADEYRIQMTTVQPPLRANPNGPTLLLGWHPELRVFAGFDLSRHTQFSHGSNSVQVSLQSLNAAVTSGFGFYTNQFGEIAVAFRPSQLLHYAEFAARLHTYGPAAVELLQRVARLESVPDAEVQRLPNARRLVIRQIRQLVRAANFRDLVMTAYGRRCAVTGMQLRLVDAAHIVPVGADGSDDSVRNGIALSPTYHRAFDHGLIFLDHQLRMQLNLDRSQQLAAARLADGLRQFQGRLGRTVHLPPARTDWPTRAIINRANQFRGIRC